MASEPLGSATVRRVEWLTLLIGGLGAIWAGWHWGWRGAAGLMLGAVLSWINFRWLKGSVTAFGAAAVAQTEQQMPPAAAPATGTPAAPAEVVRPATVPVSAYLKFIGRFALLLGAVYVILTRSWFPVASVLAGLFASAAGVLVGLTGELLASGARDSFRRGS
jgi:hypothetical protein